MSNSENKKRPFITFIRGEKRSRHLIDIRHKCDLLAQIFSVRAAQDDWLDCENDDLLVEDVLILCDAPWRDDQFKKNTLRCVFTSDSYNCLARELIRKKIVTNERPLYTLDSMLSLHALPQGAFVNAEMLLQTGASAHVGLKKYPDQIENKTVYGVAALATQGDEAGLRLLLKYGAQVNAIYCADNPLMSALNSCTSNARAIINTLLYYGADSSMQLYCDWMDRYPSPTPLAVSISLAQKYPRLSELNRFYNLCLHGHARRVYRMAHYLQRLTQLPLDVAYVIIEYHYGKKLNETDREVFATLQPTDYKIDRRIIK